MALADSEWAQAIESALATKSFVDEGLKRLQFPPEQERAAEQFVSALREHIEVLQECLCLLRENHQRYKNLPESLRLPVLASVGWKSLLGECSAREIANLWNDWPSLLYEIHGAASLSVQFVNEEDIKSNVRTILLQLFCYGIWASANHNRKKELCDSAISKGEALVLEGETDSRVRAALIWLIGQRGELEDNAEIKSSIFERGLKLGNVFVSAGETSGGVRTNILWLYHQLGDRPVEGRLSFLRNGIRLGETFVESGEKRSEVWLYLLKLYAKICEIVNDPEEREALYKRGLIYGDMYLSSGLSDGDVRTDILYLYVVAGDTAPDPQQSRCLYECGLKLGNSFLSAGETSGGVRANILWLYHQLGALSGEERLSFWRDGIRQGEGFVECEEKHPMVWSNLLSLYDKVGQMLDDPTESRLHYQRGLDLGNTYISSGKKDGGVRANILKIYIDAGEKAADPKEKHSLFESGLHRAETFLASDERNSNVRGNLLSLFIALGNTCAFSDDALDFYERGISYGELFVDMEEIHGNVPENLLMLFNNASHKAQSEERARSYISRGLSHGATFVDLGGRGGNFRRNFLRLFNSAGDLAECPDDARKYFVDGLSYAEMFIQDGETDSEVRDQVLRLFLNAGTKAENSEAALEFFGKGILYGTSFVAGGETSSIIRAQVLELFTVAGLKKSSIANLGTIFGLNEVNQILNSFKKCIGREFFDYGLQYGEAFIAEGEKSKEVLEWILHLTIYSVISESNPDIARSFISKGLQHGEAFISRGETSSIVSGALVILYELFVFHSDIKEDEHCFSAKGIWHGEHLLSEGSITPEVMHSLLGLYINACASANSMEEAHSLAVKGIEISKILTNPDASHPLFLLRLLSLYKSAAMTTRAPEKKKHFFTKGVLCGERIFAAGDMEVRSIFEFFLLCLHFAALEPLHSFVNYVFPMSALSHHADVLSIKGDYFKTKIHKETRERFTKLLADLSKQQPSALKAWNRFLERWLLRWNGESLAHQNFSMRSTCLLTTVGLLTLLQAGRNKKFRHLRDEVNVLQEDMRHLSRDEQLSIIEQAIEKISIWLGEDIADRIGLPEELSTPGEISLGLLLAPSVNLKESLRIWAELSPWDNPEILSQHLMAADVDRLIFDDQQLDRPLHIWFKTHGRKLWANLDENHVLAELPAALEALDAGNNQELRDLLALAWQQSCLSAARLARLFGALSNCTEDLAQILLDMNDPITDIDATALLNQAGGEKALTAVIFGRGRELLSQAIRSWLVPSEYLNHSPDQALFGVKRMFNRAISAHPAPALHAQLAERLHLWSSELLAVVLSEPEPDLEFLWSLPEYGRAGLHALTAKYPDDAWFARTGEKLVADMKTGFALAGKTERWLALDGWLENIEEAFGQEKASSFQSCRDRLNSGEALVQLFFDPDPGKGGLCALWLTREKGPLLERLPEVSRLSAWDGTDGVLKLWNAFRQAEPAPDDLKHSREVWSALAEDPVITAVLDHLWQKGEALRCRHLAVIFPASLGQLPWEALAAETSAWPPGYVERAVSLSLWRRPTSTNDEHSAAVFFDNDHKSVPFGGPQASAMADFFATQNLRPSKPDLTAFDLVSELGDCQKSHLIFHGEYVPFRPQESGLKLHINSDSDYMPLWALSAVGLGHGFHGLSACEAALSGIAPEESLMGPVGVAPAMIAAGARVVIGNLLKVAPITAWVFWAKFAESPPDTPPEKALALACDKLRRMSAKEVEDFFIQRLDKKEYATFEPAFNRLLAQDKPFAHPAHWAGWVAFGASEGASPSG